MTDGFENGKTNDGPGREPEREPERDPERDPEREMDGDRSVDPFDEQGPVGAYEVVERTGSATDPDPDGSSIGTEPDAEPPAPASKHDRPAGGKPLRERVDRWRRGAAGEGEALSRVGVLGWRFFVVMGAGALIAAVVLAVTNTAYAQDANFWQKLGPGSRETLRVLLRAPIHLSIGMLAFALSAWAVGVRAGRGDLAAARIGLAVSLAIMALELRWGFPGQRVVVYLTAFVLYFTALLLSFRCPPRVAGMLIAMHAGLFAAIAGLGWLIVWVGL